MRVFINYAAAWLMRSQLSVLGNISGGGITLFIRDITLQLQMATDNGLFKRSLSVACRHDETNINQIYQLLC